MNRILLLAHREILELARQRAMLGVIAALFGAIGAFVLAAASSLQLVSLTPQATAAFEAWFPALGLQDVQTGDLLGVVVGLGNFLIFTQYLGIAGVLAGHTVLHDRQSHTLPFLLLAPVGRAELLLGKVLGAVALPTALYIAISVLVMGPVAALPLAAAHAGSLPLAPAWWLATLVGAPTWALAVGILCAIVSATASDVRTAQQGVWFIMFFATFGAGYLLAGRLSDGLLAQAMVLALALALLVAALLLGARIISRDLGR